MNNAASFRLHLVRLFFLLAATGLCLSACSSSSEPKREKTEQEKQMDAMDHRVFYEGWLHPH